MYSIINYSSLFSILKNITIPIAIAASLTNSMYFMYLGRISCPILSLHERQVYKSSSKSLELAITLTKSF